MAEEIRESKDMILHRQAVERFLRYDQEGMINTFRLKADSENIYVRFLGDEYRIDRKTGELYCGNRPADLDEMASIYEYLTYSDKQPRYTGEWASISQLCTNTTDTSLSRYIDALQCFHGHMDQLREACERLGGVPVKKGDASSIIPVFEMVSVWFQYWEADDEFPASVQFLWDGAITESFRWSLLWNIMSCICNKLKSLQ